MAESISLEMGAPIDWSIEEQSSSGANHIKNFIKTLKNFSKIHKCTLAVNHQMRFMKHYILLKKILKLLLLIF